MSDQMSRQAAYGNFAIDALLMMPDSPEVESQRHAVAKALEVALEADGKVEENLREGAAAAVEKERVYGVLKQAMVGGPALLALADSTLADKLPSREVLTRMDPASAVEKMACVANRSPNKGARIIGGLLGKALAERTTIDERIGVLEVKAIDLELAFKRTCTDLQKTAKDAETFIRARAEPDSPAMKFVKRYYTRKAAPAPVPPGPAPHAVAQSVAAVPVTTGTSAPAANDAAPATPEDHTRVA